MTSDLPIYLLVVTLISLITNIIINRYYKINITKLLVFTLCMPILGVLSTMIMSFIESGSFKGTSFFGAVFIMPIMSIIFSTILKEERWKFFNLTAFLGMITYATLKFRCYQYGCCIGKKMMTHNGPITFPSQIVEMTVGIITFIALLLLYRKNKKRKDLLPILMVVYGIERFFLNSFRLVKPIFAGLAYCHIWSILCTIIGLIWLLIIKSKQNTKNYKKEI